MEFGGAPSGTSGASTKWLGKGRFWKGAGAATDTFAGGASNIRIPAWALRDAQSDTISGLIGPDELVGWTTFKIEALIVGVTPTVVGNLIMRTDYGFLGDGDVLAETSGSNTGALANPATDVLKFVELATGISVVADKMLRVEIARLGSDASDTVTADLPVAGVRLSKVP